MVDTVGHHGKHHGSHRGTPWIFSYTKVLIFLIKKYKEKYLHDKKSKITLKNKQNVIQQKN